MSRWRRMVTGVRSAASVIAAAGALAIAGMSGATRALAVEPGAYLYVEGGHSHGMLVVKGGRFDIETIGGNCHTCSVSGTLKGGTAVATDGGETCRLSMTGSQDALNVDSRGSEGCRAYCGVRAVLDGQYRRPPAACEDGARAKRHAQARALYAKKDYAAAATGFSSLIGECSTFMDWIEVDSVRSDLALTQYHLGDNARCLATLAPTVAMQNGGGDDSADRADQAGQSAQDADFGLPPCDADNYRATGKAIRHNAALCKAPREK